MSDNRREALEALRDKVKSGEGVPSALLFKLTDVLGTPQIVYDAYHGSLDAAKALHEAVLPGWWWKTIAPEPNFAQVGMPDVGVFSGQSDNIARAWLLSILSALISEAPKGETP